MNVLQAYYTSCLMGQTGNAGFQFYSYSDGLTETELIDIQRMGKYNTPSNLPHIPSEDEIQQLFPRIFRYFKLSSGRVGVLQSVYLGMDYSNRPGNYLVHAMVLESGNFPFAPIELYESESFRDNLTEVEWNASTPPPKLPTLTLKDLRRNPTINPSQVQRFLSESRENKLTDLLNAVIEYNTTNRRIIISDEPLNFSFWLAAISYALPEEIRNSICFSNYHNNPNFGGPMICGALEEGTEFQFNTENYQFDNYIFNFHKNKFSEASLSSDFAEIANLSLISPNDNFKNLILFFNNFSYPVINKEVDFICGLFELQRRNGPLPKIWDKLFQFSCEYGTQEFLNGFISQHKSPLERSILSFINDEQRTIKLFEQLFTVLGKTKKEKDFKEIFELYLTWLTSYIFRPEGETLNNEFSSQLLKTNKKIVEHFLNFGKGFIQLFFNKNNLQLQESFLSDTQHNSLYTATLSILFQNAELCEVEKQQLFINNSIRKILNNYISKIKSGQNIIYLFSIIKDKDIYSGLLNIVINKIPERTLLSIAQASPKDIFSVNEFYDLVIHTGNTKLLLEFSTYFYNNLDNKKKLLLNSIYFLNENDGSGEEYGYILKPYIENNIIKANDIPELLNLIKHKEPLITLLELYESLINIEKDRKNETHYTIHKFKKKSKLETNRNLTELLILLNHLEEGEVTTVLKALKQIDANLNQLSKSELSYFISTFFEYTIPLVKKERDFVFLFLFLESIKQANHFPIFQKETLKFVNKEKDPDVLFYLLSFLFHFEKYKQELQNVSKKSIQNFSIEVLVNEKKSSLKRLSTVFSKKGKEETTKWRKIEAAVIEKRSKTFKGKVIKLLDSFLKN